MPDSATAQAGLSLPLRFSAGSESENLDQRCRADDNAPRASLHEAEDGAENQQEVMVNRRFYLIPGRGERLDEGLGRLIIDMGYAIHGRELVSDFARLRFAEQLALIRSDLQPPFWQAETLLVGRSYGAYLLLHTLADMEPFPGRIMLCSPVLGAAVVKNGSLGSLPPRTEKLIKMAETDAFPAPRYMEIHTGADDNGCDPQLANRFASLVSGTRLHIVAGAGHDLGDEYTRSALREFCQSQLRLEDHSRGVCIA